MLGRASDGRCYVLELHRHRAPIESTASLLRAVGGRYPGVVPRWSCGGQERAVADLLATHGVTLATRPATSDKATRAQPLAAAWARGDVLLPREASWIDALLRELAEFPQSRHDDQIDALTSAYEGAGVYATGPVAASRPSYAQRPRPYTSRSSPYSGGSPYLQQIGDRTIARFPGDRKYRRW